MSLYSIISIQPIIQKGCIMKKSLFVTVLIALVMACGTFFTLMAYDNKSNEEIESEMASGVVLVQNQSYYEIDIPGRKPIYFSGFDDEGNIEGRTEDKGAVKQVLFYGTGFFISNKGQIATNMHVVNSKLDDEDVQKIKTNFTSYYASEKKRIMARREEASYDYDCLATTCAYGIIYDDMSFSDLMGYSEEAVQLQAKMDDYDKKISDLENINMADAEIKCHVKISIAYNDSHVTSTEDFIPCVVTKKDMEHDLAIIELKDRTTPESKHVFEVPAEDPLENYGFHDKITKTLSNDKNSLLHMAGFNYGPLVDVTQSSLKSQFNTGTISQNTDDRLMYSIQVLCGSSGSPVVNRSGELVAINHAGLAESQGFNYGIKVKHLRNLMDQ